MRRARAPPRTIALLLPLAVLGLWLAPAVEGHGAGEVREFEVEVLRDEVSDHYYATGGYDISQIFLGEAHDPSVGVGAAGDGIYFRADLYGDFTSPAAGPYRVAFRFQGPNGEIERSLSTRDGRAFDTDFDALVIETDGDVARVERAFITYASAGLAAGAEVRDIVVESYADGELVDRAPGGLFLPGIGGRVEVPQESRRLVEAVKLEGPARYLNLASTAIRENEVNLRVASALREGGQHIHLQPRASPGWTVNVQEPSSVSVKASETAAFQLLLAASNGAPPLRVDVLTDVGGRMGLDIHHIGGAFVIVPEGETPRPAPDATPAAIPLPWMVAVIGVALAAAAMRRR